MNHKYFFGPSSKYGNPSYAMKYDDQKKVLIIGCYGFYKFRLETLIKEFLKMPLSKENRPCTNKVRYKFRMEYPQFLNFMSMLKTSGESVSEPVSSLGRVFR